MSSTDLIAPLAEKWLIRRRVCGASGDACVARRGGAGTQRRGWHTQAGLARRGGAGTQRRAVACSIADSTRARRRTRRLRWKDISFLLLSQASGSLFVSHSASTPPTYPGATSSSPPSLHHLRPFSLLAPIREPLHHLTTCAHSRCLSNCLRPYTSPANKPPGHFFAWSLSLDSGDLHWTHDPKHHNLPWRLLHAWSHSLDLLGELTLGSFTGLG